MLTINNKELRNLEEQVLKNKQDIAKHYEIDRTLANFGIKIVGTVTDVNDLPNPLYYEGEYGDGYAVGKPGSYVYYIFTRPDPNAGINENHWLDVGQLGIMGPEGPAPIISNDGTNITSTNPETGVTTNVVSLNEIRGESTKWLTSKTLNNITPKNYDMLMTDTGDVYQFITDDWIPITKIKGTTGNTGKTGPAPFISSNKGYITSRDPQTGKVTNIVDLKTLRGPRGYTGEAGKFVTIAGILNSSSQLPRPSQIKNLSLAYLVGKNEPYKLWIQIGDEVETAVWEPMGPFNVATAVTVDGQYRSTWNADTKLDLIEPKSIQKDFVTVVRTPSGYYQENMIATYTPEASYPHPVGVLRGTEGDIRGLVPDNPNAYTLVNIEYLNQRLEQLKNEILSQK